MDADKRNPTNRPSREAKATPKETPGQHRERLLAQIDSVMNTIDLAVRDAAIEMQAA